MKGCAGAHGALDVNFSGMLLNDAVGDAEAEAGATLAVGSGDGFGGEERIVDTLEMVWRDAGAGVGDDCFYVTIDERGDAQASAAGHGVTRVEKQVQENLLELTGVALDFGELIGEFEIDIDLSGLELMLQ